MIQRKPGALRNGAPFTEMPDAFRQLQGYVELAGGPEKMLAAGRTAAARGEYRWAAEVLQKLTFAMPEDVEARAALADVYEQLGYQSESGQWRNFYLSASRDLRQTHKPAAPFTSAGDDTLRAVTTHAYLDALATRLDPARIGDAPLTVNLVITDRGERALLTVSNRVLVGEVEQISGQADAVIKGSWDTVLKLFSLRTPLPQFETENDLKIEGNKLAVERLRSALINFTADFTP